ncbi:uncharacterized protein LOC131174017 [Hevea brasiliensis]|uniref:uncharacterized protein LOC131174017 n=1 Tax=Hevea brasiliensis TaxID=3981 RepID=UPI0025ED0C2B|nr:uncharacterized protein LOC131174017 [Hevea brasiliensis]
MTMIARILQKAVGDYVFLKVFLMKEVMRFRKKGKLTPRYIWPFEITDRVRAVAYRLELPPSFSHVHPPVFYISMLKKYIPDPSYVLRPHTMELNEDLTFEEQPIDIVYYQMRQLIQSRFLWLRFCGGANRKECT